jgi:hypothetical protein
MRTHTVTIDDLLNQINRLTTTADSGRIRQAMNQFARQATADERETARKVLSRRLKELAIEGEQALQ